MGIIPVGLLVDIRGRRPAMIGGLSTCGLGNFYDENSIIFLKKKIF